MVPETELLQKESARDQRARWLVQLIFLPYLVSASVYLWQLIHFVFLRNDSTFPEGVSIYAFLTAFRTGRLYAQPFEFPWNAEIFGPLFYLFGLLSATIAHGDALLTTILMRLLSFTAYLAAVAIAGCICWRLEKQKRWVWIVVVLGLANTWAVPWVASARPDALSILFIMAALLIYLSAEGRIWFVFAAGVVASLSWFTKQTTAPLLVALILDAFIGRKWKSAAALIVGSVPIPAVILCVLWMRHEPVLANMTAGRFVAKHWGTVPGGIFYLLRMNELALIALGVAILGAFLTWSEEGYRPLLLAAVIGFLSNAAALANVGSNYNYFILPWLLALLFVPVGLKQIETWSTGRPWIPVGLFLVAALLLMHRSYLLRSSFPPDLDASGVSSLTMLSDLSYLEARSREPQLLDPYTYGEFSEQKKWSNAPILQRIDDEHYDLILMSEDPHFAAWAWRPEMRAEAEAHYRVLCEVDHRAALVPLNRTDTPHAEDLMRIFGEPCRAPSVMP
jgi:hypothetical protein